MQFLPILFAYSNVSLAAFVHLNSVAIILSPTWNFILYMQKIVISRKYIQKFNKTALHIAVQQGDIEIIKLLLRVKNIDINIEDEQGKKTIDYSKNDEIRKLFSH